MLVVGLKRAISDKIIVKRSAGYNFFFYTFLIKCVLFMQLCRWIGNKSIKWNDKLFGTHNSYYFFQ
uniref:Uncharacterized protein n=1 Tax=Triticum urartu TaxID=4572 RepID=A0A8R7Q9Z0_TRIUA